MGRPVTKSELLNAAEENYGKMKEMISSMSEKELSTPFDFPGKKEAHWKRDSNVRDILVHLYEWHMLLLDWVRANQEGSGKAFLPEPYNWKTYGSMNVEFWKKHQGTPQEKAEEMLAESHRKVMELAETFSDEELFTKGVFKWVGSSTLGSYFVSNTSSHYDWAMKKLKAHRRNCGQDSRIHYTGTRKTEV